MRTSAAVRPSLSVSSWTSPQRQLVTDLAELHDDVYYYIGEGLKLEGETENMKRPRDVRGAQLAGFPYVVGSGVMVCIKMSGGAPPCLSPVFRFWVFACALLVRVSLNTEGWVSLPSFVSHRGLFNTNHRLSPKKTAILEPRCWRSRPGSRFNAGWFIAGK